MAEPVRQKPSTPAEILDFLDDLYRGDSSHGRIAMTIVTRNWTRSLKIEQWTSGRNLSLVRILAPQKEKGSATLRIDFDVWNWLPNVSRVVKVSSSMLAGSWMGSHFTNDDLVKQSRFADDYTSEITLRSPRDGVDVIELTMTPKPEAPVVWGKVIAIVREADTMPVVVTFFDEGMKPARSLRFGGYAQLGGRLLPTVARMIPADQDAEYTETVYSEFSFSIPIESSFFSVHQLQKQT